MASYGCLPSIGPIFLRYSQLLLLYHNPIALVLYIKRSKMDNMTEGEYSPKYNATIKRIQKEIAWQMGPEPGDSHRRLYRLWNLMADVNKV